MSSAAKKRQEAGLLTAVGVASAAASFLVLPTWAGFVTVGLFLLLVGWLWNPARRHRPMLYVGGVILIVVGAAWWGNDHGKRHSSSSPDFEALAASINHAIRAGRSSPGSPDAIGNIRASVADYVNGARLVLGRAALETSQENEDIAQRVAQFAAVRQNSSIRASWCSPSSYASQAVMRVGSVGVGRRYCRNSRAAPPSTP